MKFRLSLIVFLAAVTATAFLVEDIGLMALLHSVYLVIFVSLLVAGVSIIKWNWFLNSVNTAGKNQVAFTFDDGPQENTPKILEVLAKHQVKGSFFLIGENCEKKAELVKRLHDEGHTIGNHSYSHVNKLGWSSTVKLKREIEAANQVIQKITGKPVQYFRPPFGVTNPNVAKAVLETGMKSVGWDIRTYDTVVKDADKIVKKAKSAIDGNGNIILMHDSCEHSVDALDQLISYCKEKGMDIVTIDQITK